MEMFLLKRAHGSIHITLKIWLKIQTMLSRILTIGVFIANISAAKKVGSLLTHQCSSIQAHSAPARGWDIGRFERSDSSAVLQCQGSSPVRESQPWSHLQTFALSAPGHDDRSSRDFQIEAISQWPSSLQDNEVRYPSTTESRRQRQASAKHKKTQDSPYSAEGNITHNSRLRNQAKSARSLHLADFGAFESRIPNAGEQEIAGSSTSSSFSQPVTSGLHTESNPAQSFGFRSAYQLQHPTFNELEGSTTGPCQDLEIDFSLHRGLVNESGHSSLPASQDILTPQELSWRQHDHFHLGHQLSASADTAYDFYDLGPTANDQIWPSDLMHDPAFGFPSRQTYVDTNALDHPGAIKIKRSSGHYKSDLTSSFPPSADCFPDYMPTNQNPRRNRAVASTSQPAFLSSSPPNFPSRKDSNKFTSVRASRSASLSIIREYGHSQHGSPTLPRNNSAKGKRKGPLPTATALAAAQKRKDGSVCIRCRTMKMTVCRSGRMLESWLINVVQRGPSLRGVSSDYEGQIFGPVLYPCEFYRYG